MSIVNHLPLVRLVLIKNNAALLFVKTFSDLTESRSIWYITSSFNDGLQ